MLPGAQPVNLRRVQSQENQFLPCFLDVCRVNLMVGFHSFEFFAAGRTDSNQLLRALQFLVLRFKLGVDRYEFRLRCR